MPISRLDKAMTHDDIEDLFAGLGQVTIKRMFGGKGVYHQGLIVAVEIGGVMWLKADAATASAFEAAGAERWVYAKPGGQPVGWPYWTVPDDAFDDPDVAAAWVRLAYEAALRSPPKAKR